MSRFAWSTLRESKAAVTTATADAIGNAKSGGTTAGGGTVGRAAGSFATTEPPGARGAREALAAVPTGFDCGNVPPARRSPTESVLLGQAVDPRAAQQRPGEITMAGETIVFFPKYTALVVGTYYSDPYDVTGYKTVDVQTMHVTSIGTAPTASVQMQQSSDLITWDAVGSAMAPVAGQTDTEPLSGTARYVRAVATIGGTTATAVIWVKGVARES